MDCLDDDSVLAFLEGDLDESRRTDVERHLAGCPICADLVATAAGGVPEALALRSLGEVLSTGDTVARGEQIGRYIILNLVGRGGMGDVYAAYDPRLDRKVALKLLRDPSDHGPKARQAQERLLQEAQSTARLSHPNVVVVYDAGAIEGETRGARVYLAMEFVDGQTLAAWLAAAPRPWRTIRDVFLAAGEGLAAAHKAGLVHRDFKPQNVMVASDGAVRVMDFGLAGDASGASQASDPALAWSRTVTALNSRTVALTKTGALLGTPLYMAPEQFLTRVTDARADQFSFCVALYEALYGERPFAADDMTTLVNTVVAGRVCEPPQKTRVPAFLRRILLRGLQATPNARFASMHDLLTALRADPARRRRARLVGAGVIAAALLASLGAQRIATRGARMCQGGSDELAGIWELDAAGKRRAEIHDAFLATGLPFAQGTWTRVSRLLDDYSRQWTVAYTDNCEATHVRGDQSAEVLDLRMTCLDQRRHALRALTDVLSHADATTLAQGVNAAHALPPLDRCSDVPTLRAVVPPPTKAARVRVAELEGKLAEIKVLFDAGQWWEGDRRLAPILKDVRAVGYKPLLAETLAVDALLKVYIGNWNDMRRAAQEAFFTGLSAGRDDIAIDAASNMVVGNIDLGHLIEAQRWDALAQALIPRLGSGHDRLASWFHQDRAILLDSLGDHQGAIAELSEALALKQRILPRNHPDTGRSFLTLGLLHSRHGDGSQALLAIDQGLVIDRIAYGRENPLLWDALDDRGEALEVLHRYSEAESDLRRSAEMVASLYGPNHQYNAHPLTALGRTLLAEGKEREAVSVLERAFRLREHAEQNPELVAETRFALARAYWAVNHDRPGTLKMARAAREVYLQIPGRKNRVAEIDQWLAGR